MTRNLKEKIELSELLEKVETNADSLHMQKKLDLFHSKAKAHVVGVTGSPGTGKSSLIDKLVKHLRGKNKSVGVIAIDPSSDKSGGALLGDRTRFLLDPNDDQVFVRSMATKNYLGGVSELTYPTMIVMRSIFDYLIVETVGVGQSETFIRDVSDTVILCVQPGSGDTIQFMKSGIFEIPDIVVVTKSDIEKLPDITFADLSASKGYFQNMNDWDINIILTSSFKNIGFDRLYRNLSLRWQWLNERGRINETRHHQDIRWIKKNILKNFGEKGLKKVEKSIKYKSSPFKTLKYIKEIVNF